MNLLRLSGEKNQKKDATPLAYITKHVYNDAMFTKHGINLDFDIVVTRHDALVEFLNWIGLCARERKAHVAKEDVLGKHVIGVLPLHLASKAASVTEVVLELTQDQRGKELTFEEVEAAYRGIKTFVVREVSPIIVGRA